MVGAGEEALREGVDLAAEAAAVGPCLSLMRAS